jgi:hypothetical protein
MAKAKSFRSTLLVDGWTAMRCIGTIGVSLCCLSLFFAYPIVLSGTTKGSAEGYAAKLNDVVDWSMVFFICTDGASNMIALANLLRSTKHVTPVLCAAHGMSLIVHYIAKVFGSELGFISMCKTRMAYQTLALLRVLRLRNAARKACIGIKVNLETEDEQVDSFSKFAQVKKSLKDDTLFHEIETFCRITLPVLLAMREVDKGTPIAGFVYWLHYHIEVQVGLVLEKLNDKVSSFERLKKDVLSAIRLIWDKRHRPVLSFAYLTKSASPC